MSSSAGTQGSEHSSNTCNREVEREPGLSGTREATHKHQSRRVRVGCIRAQRAALPRVLSCEHREVQEGV